MPLEDSGPGNGGQLYRSIMERLTSIDNKLDNKADRESFRLLNDQVNALRVQVESNKSGVQLLQAQVAARNEYGERLINRFETHEERLRRLEDSSISEKTLDIQREQERREREANRKWIKGLVVTVILQGLGLLASIVYTINQGSPPPTF